MTRHLLIGAAMLLVGSSAAWAQSSTTSQAQSAASPHSYGSAAMQGTTGHDGLMGIPAYISPNDPAYSYFEPIHRGQASESSAADSSWNGPYTQLGHDSGM
jgi:hypothetical protein